MVKARQINAKFFVVCTAMFFLLGLASRTEAAFLYFDPLSVEVYRGDTVSLDLRIDTDEGECINTIDSVIHYDESIRAVDISRGDSILSVWVEPPVINEDDRTISFAGGIPGGYCGRISGDPKLTNVVLTALFRSPGFSIGGGEETPEVTLKIDSKSQVLLHDGFGTPAPLRLQDATLTLLDTPGTSQSDAWREEIQNDDTPPSDFAITLTQDTNAFGGDYFIVFNSLDKQSGIDHYEVFEEPFSEFWSFKWGRADAPWKVVESPHVLEDQSLHSTIWVKAIDKAGNEKVEKLVPDQALQSASRNTRLVITSIGAFVVLMASLLIYAVWRRKQNRNNEIIIGNENGE